MSSRGPKKVVARKSSFEFEELLKRCKPTDPQILARIRLANSPEPERRCSALCIGVRSAKVGSLRAVERPR